MAAAATDDLSIVSFLLQDDEEMEMDSFLFQGSGSSLTRHEDDHDDYDGVDDKKGGFVVVFGGGIGGVDASANDPAPSLDGTDESENPSQRIAKTTAFSAGGGVGGDIEKPGVVPRGPDPVVVIDSSQKENEHNPFKPRLTREHSNVTKRHARHHHRPSSSTYVVASSFLHPTNLDPLHPRKRPSPHYSPHCRLNRIGSSGRKFQDYHPRQAPPKRRRKQQQEQAGKSGPRPPICTFFNFLGTRLRVPLPPPPSSQHHHHHQYHGALQQTQKLRQQLQHPTSINVVERKVTTATAAAIAIATTATNTAYPASSSRSSPSTRTVSSSSLSSISNRQPLPHLIMNSSSSDSNSSRNSDRTSDNEDGVDDDDITSQKSTSSSSSSSSTRIQTPPPTGTKPSKVDLQQHRQQDLRQACGDAANAIAIDEEDSDGEDRSKHSNRSDARNEISSSSSSDTSLQPSSPSPLTMTVTSASSPPKTARDVMIVTPIVIKQRASSSTAERRVVPTPTQRAPPPPFIDSSIESKNNFVLSDQTATETTVATIMTTMSTGDQGDSNAHGESLACATNSSSSGTDKEHESRATATDMTLSLSSSTEPAAAQTTPTIPAKTNGNKGAISDDSSDGANENANISVAKNHVSTSTTNLHLQDATVPTTPLTATTSAQCAGAKTVAAAIPTSANLTVLSSSDSCNSSIDVAVAAPDATSKSDTVAQDSPSTLKTTKSDSSVANFDETAKAHSDESCGDAKTKATSSDGSDAAAVDDTTATPFNDSGAVVEQKTAASADQGSANTSESMENADTDSGASTAKQTTLSTTSDDTSSPIRPTNPVEDDDADSKRMSQTATAPSRDVTDCNGQNNGVRPSCPGNPPLNEDVVDDHDEKDHRHVTSEIDNSRENGHIPAQVEVVIIYDEEDEGVAYNANDGDETPFHNATLTSAPLAGTPPLSTTTTTDPTRHAPLAPASRNKRKHDQVEVIILDGEEGDNDVASYHTFTSYTERTPP